MTGLILAMLLQSADPAAIWDGLPPDLGSLQEEPKRRKVEALGFEVFVIGTQFDDGLRIEEEVGSGGDLKLGWAWEDSRTTISLSLGYAGWNTENDEDKALPTDVVIRQYRLGFTAEVPFRFASLGVGVTGGVFRFRGDFEDDTSPYIEFEGSFGIRPVPEFRIALLGLSNHAQSSYNRESTHLFHNYSWGISAEITF